MVAFIIPTTAIALSRNTIVMLELKKIMEVFRTETKTILAVVLGVFSALLLVSLVFQDCQFKRRFDTIESRLDTLTVLHRNLETRIGEMEPGGFAGRGEVSRETMGAGISGGNTGASALDSGAYCASRNPAVFHYPWCEHAQKISPGNLIWFKTRQEAIKTGRRPCRVCIP